MLFEILKLRHSLRLLYFKQHLQTSEVILHHSRQQGLYFYSTYSSKIGMIVSSIENKTNKGHYVWITQCFILHQRINLFLLVYQLHRMQTILAFVGLEIFFITCIYKSVCNIYELSFMKVNFSCLLYCFKSKIMQCIKYCEEVSGTAQLCYKK